MLVLVQIYIALEKMRIEGAQAGTMVDDENQWLHSIVYVRAGGNAGGVMTLVCDPHCPLFAESFRGTANWRRAGLDVIMPFHVGWELTGGGFRVWCNLTELLRQVVLQEESLLIKL